MPISIELVPFDTICEHKDFFNLVDEYIDETANDAIPSPGPQVKAYKALDERGVLRCIAVFDADSLAGLALATVTPSQHYPYPILALDSLFLRKPWRKGRLGLDLLGSVRALAKREGAPGFVIMAPPGSKLERLCERFGYVNTHKAYWCKA